MVALRQSDVLELQGPRLLLTSAGARERVAAQRWSRDPEVSRYLSSPEGLPPAAEVSGSWWEGLFRKRQEAIFAIRLADAQRTHIGNIGLHNWDRGRGEADLGIIIGEPSNFDRGYGSEAVVVLLREGFASWGLRRVRLQVLAANARGRRCYEKCGFRQDRAVTSPARSGRGPIDVIYMSVTAELLAAAAPEGPSALGQ